MKDLGLRKGDKVVALLSGGLDSSTALALASSIGAEVYALSFDYGQRHVKELSAASILASQFAIRHEIARLPNFLFNAGSLAGNEDLPTGHYAADNMKSTIVPNRNSVLLALGFAWSETVGARGVMIGAHAGDHPIYPDCRPEFLVAFEGAESLALGHPTELFRPFAALSKGQIVSLGAELKVPFDKTWSCYLGGAVHCGKCGTCVERKEAFRLALVKDPTVYADESFAIPVYRG